MASPGDIILVDTGSNSESDSAISTVYRKRKISSSEPPAKKSAVLSDLVELVSQVEKGTVPASTLPPVDPTQPPTMLARTALPPPSKSPEMVSDLDLDLDLDLDRDLDLDLDRDLDRDPPDFVPEVGNEDNENSISDSDVTSDASKDSGVYKAALVDAGPSGGEIPRSEVFAARLFLRTRGRNQFVREYLPKVAYGDDIIRAIGVLGFNVDTTKISGTSVRSLINVLRYAIKRVETHRRRLTDFWSIDLLLHKIKTANNIIVITGAGISTSLGIPDFRSSKGFYSRLNSLGLDDPQQVFDLDFFKADPTIFYSIAHMILPPSDAFTPLHAFIKLLDSKKKLLRNYTQNIDNLEENAKISREKIVQCHGSFATATCMTCKFNVPLSFIRKDLLKKTPSICPKCKKRRRILEDKEGLMEESYGIFKPDITFFHEKLPDRFHSLINEDLAKCDLLISIGTSLEVAPVADIVKKIADNIPQVLINKNIIPHHEFDISLLGHCDDVATYLCDKLGWELKHKDFKKLLGVNHDNLYLGNIGPPQNGSYSVTNRTA